MHFIGHYIIHSVLNYIAISEATHKARSQILSGKRRNKITATVTLPARIDICSEQNDDHDAASSLTSNAVNGSTTELRPVNIRTLIFIPSKTSRHRITCHTQLR
ncbi:hypothetical protein DPMN_133306 [Dreissena polymorpha]|uniref:Uncharacterized protein n=1 Tax=Dreissena polymorpha TaxID=45954 RepID=A0A9D4FTB2_DREPO|nr:hypothetical protein DPMN_133306 [Dreissena polymorpha]